VSAGHRCEIETIAGPAREGILGGRALLLVRVRLFDNDCVDAPRPDAWCDLRPEHARRLALALLDAADDAEAQTIRAHYWQTRR
jgi:hypothetical protein